MGDTEVHAFAVDLQARLKTFEKQMVQASNLTESKLRGIERRFAAANDNISRSLNPDKIRTGLLSVAGALGAAFSVREVTAITDSYTRFTNSLKVAGVEGAALIEVQNALFASAQRNGVELEALGALYGRASQAAKTLGASQSDLLKFTDGVTNALRIQGGDPAAASGALMQLSQALQSGTVRAEEFNSVNEGAFPILQAVAVGAERFGGSVAKLRAEVLAGTVSSQEFFRAFLSGSSQLEERAAKSALTTGQAFAQLRNALVQYVGEGAQTTGATAAMAEGLKLLADNVQVIIPAIATLGVALGVGFVANATRGAVAARGLGAALLGAFGGPVGLAITAITLGVASLATEAATTQRAISALSATTSDLSGALADARALIDPTPGKLADIGTQAAGAIPGIQAFAGEIGEAAAKLWDLAAAQKAAAINRLMAERAGLSQQIEAAEQRLPGQRRAAFFSDFGFGDHGSLSDQFGRARRFVSGEIASIWSGGKTDREALDAVSAAKARMREVENGIRALGDADLKSFVDDARAVVTVTSGGKATAKAKVRGVGGGRSGFYVDPMTVDPDTVFDTSQNLSGSPLFADGNPNGFMSAEATQAALTKGLEDSRAETTAFWADTIEGGLYAAKGGFNDLAQYFGRQLQAELIRMAAVKVAQAIGQGGNFAGFFAGGGTIPTGQWGIVNDGAVEAVRARPGGGIDVMSGKALRALHAPVASRSTGAVFQTFQVNAQGAILAAGLIEEMQAIGVKAAIAGAQGGAQKAQALSIKAARSSFR